jgi:hypothetical protein
MSKKTNQKLYDLFEASDSLKKQALPKEEYMVRTRKINNKMFYWLIVAGIQDWINKVLGK